MQQKRYIWIALGVGLLVGIIGWIVLSPKSAVAPATSTATSTNTTNGSGVGLTTVGTGTAVISEVGTTGSAAIQPPTLKPIVFSASVAPEVKTALEHQYNAYAPQLRAAPNRVDLWLQLGVVYKIGGDYAGAAAAWNYVAKAGPSNVNYVAYGNLGDLYLNFTHEYAKAEVAYKAALAIKPGIADYQAGLKAAQQAQGK